MALPVRQLEMMTWEQTTKTEDLTED